MSSSDVTRDGLRGTRPGREAVPGTTAGRRRRGGRGEQPMVPPAEFTSYYGKPVLNAPVWAARDVAGYLFLGGLAGASSVLAAGAQLTDRPVLERAAKCGAAAAAGLSVAALVHDLGRPARALNMLRVFKVTSPMSVGSWLLSGYAPAAGLSAAAALAGRAPRAGAAATAAAALLGPAVSAYTAALISNTAVPAWHDGYREMPFIFAGSGAAAAGGLGLIAAPLREAAPARNLALLGGALEIAAFERMTRRLGTGAQPYSTGTAGTYLRAAKALTVLAAAGSIAGASRSRAASAASGAALMAASAATRFGIFHAGLASARDPQYTIVPQRNRLAHRPSRPS
jgi:DMSO reductase anchor subunit